MPAHSGGIGRNGAMPEPAHPSVSSCSGWSEDLCLPLSRNCENFSIVVVGTGQSWSTGCRKAQCGRLAGVEGFAIKPCQTLTKQHITGSRKLAIRSLDDSVNSGTALADRGRTAQCKGDCHMLQLLRNYQKFTWPLQGSWQVTSGSVPLCRRVWCCLARQTAASNMWREL